MACLILVEEGVDFGNRGRRLYGFRRDNLDTQRWWKLFVHCRGELLRGGGGGWVQRYRLFIWLHGCDRHVLHVPYLVDMSSESVLPQGRFGRRGNNSKGDASIRLHQASSSFVVLLSINQRSSSISPTCDRYPPSPCALCLISLIPFYLRRYMSAPNLHI